MRPLRFATLGPAGSCHDNAVQRYLEFQRLPGSEIVFCPNFDDGLEWLHGGEVDYLVQCSAHPNVHIITERYFREVHVIDTFVYPTKDLVLLSRTDVERPRTIGLVPATAGYIDLSRWETIIEEISKPVVGRKLLAGAYDSGLTHLEYLTQSSGTLRLEEYIGPVTTTWLVYGGLPRFTGELIGTPCRDFLLTGRRG
jgi:hypothetical protein